MCPREENAFLDTTTVFVYVNVFSYVLFPFFVHYWNCCLIPFFLTGGSCEHDGWADVESNGGARSSG